MDSEPRVSPRDWLPEPAIDRTWQFVAVFQRIAVDDARSDDAARTG